MLRLFRLFSPAALSCLFVLSSCRTGSHVEEEAMLHNHSTRKGPGEPVSVKTPDRIRLYEFHGHLGPYVVLGFRASKLAREKLQSPGYFDLAAQVICPTSPPPSCFIDGVQVGSGCTLGKGNLHVRAGEPVSCTFTRKNGRSVKITLRKEVPAKIKQWIKEFGVEGAGEKAWNAPEDELFEVKSGA